MDISKPWTMSRSAWQAGQGVKQPWIAEVSGVQLARMSWRARAEYDRKRHEEWDASSECKAAYDAACVEAYNRGAFILQGPDIHDDAVTAVTAGLRASEAANAAEELTAAQETNELAVEDVSVGDRVFLIMGGHYGTVTKVSKKSIRVQVETGYMQGRKPVLARAGSIRRLSHNELADSLKNK